MKVLVVEDDSKIAAVVKRGLEAEGFAEVSLDGEDGLWRATEHHHDLVIVDSMLPGRDGFEICRGLRQRGDWTPVLVLTARDAEVDETRALDSGADDYLVKPFSFPVLVAHVRALLRRTFGTAPAIEVGDLRPRSPPPTNWRARPRLDSPPGSSRCSSTWCAGPAWSRRSSSSSPASGSTTSTVTRTSSRSTSAPPPQIEPFGRHDIETVRGAATGWPPMGDESSRPAGWSRFATVRSRLTLLATALVLVAASARRGWSARSEAC